MTFVWPGMLALLLLFPFGVGLYARYQRRRRRLLARYGDALTRGFDRQHAGARRHIPRALLLLGLTVLAVAMARPQMVVSLPRVEGIVMLAFDVSGSMAADDLKPTRMEAAKAAARAFVERQPPSALIGVVSFSDSGFVVQAPTNVQEEILSTIDRMAPERGTSLANGILTALSAIGAAGTKPGPHLYTDATPAPTPTPTPVPAGSYEPAVIILLTDGENNEAPDPLGAARTAAERGVRIHTVGIGSAVGADLELEGFRVHTQLDEQMLRAISGATGGVYYRAEDSEALREVYAKLNSALVVRAEEIEITSILAGASILIFLAGGTLSLLWFGRVP